jgi:hypothetical protein
MSACLRPLTLLLLSVSTLTAQDSSGWANLAQLLGGKEIRVTMADAHSIRGEFQSAAADSLVLSTANSSQTLSRATIVRISARGKSHRARNALIGIGVGAAAGLTTGAIADGSCPRNGCFIVGKNFGKEVLTPMGALVGGLIGVLIPTGRWRDVYRAK